MSPVSMERLVSQHATVQRLQTSSLQAKRYKKNYAPRGWMTEASLLLVRGFQRSSDVPKIRNRFEKNNQLEP